MINNSVFISDNDTGGGIAFNVIALSEAFLEIGKTSKVCFLNKGFFKSITSLINAENNTCFYTTSGKSLLIASFVSLLRLFTFKKTFISPIIYHPRFCDRNISKFRAVLRAAIFTIPKSNIIYYCDEAKLASEPDDIYGNNNIIGLCSNMKRVKPEQIEENIEQIFDSYAIHISTVGRMVDFKLGYLISLIDYAKSHPNILLSIIGYGPSEHILKQRAADAKNIIFLGERTIGEVKAIVSRCDIFVGMGTTLADAVELGKTPIVAIESSKHGLTTGFFGEQGGVHYGEYKKKQNYFELNQFVNDAVSDVKKVDKSHLPVISKPHNKLLSMQDGLVQTSFLNSIKISLILILSFILRLFGEKDYH